MIRLMYEVVTKSRKEVEKTDIYDIELIINK